jgi:glycosyltransferase involved in cell wall biosynthesis
VNIDLDVVVVNNNCTDATDSVIDEFRVRLPLRRVFEAQPGVAHSRNAALSSSAGGYVVFVDDDALVDESWLVEFEAATRAFPHAAAIGGVIEPWFPDPPDANLLEAFQWLKMGFCGLDHRREPGPLPDDFLIYGPNMAYRMAAVKDLRFDPTFGGTPTSTIGGDERDLLRRLRAAGGVVIWWPKMRIRHYVLPARTTLAYCLRFAADKGREQVWAGPIQRTRALFGVPRWLWRRWATVVLTYLASHAVPGERSFSPELLSGRVNVRAPRRVRTLTWRRELAFIGGMIRGYRQRRA